MNRGPGSPINEMTRYSRSLAYFLPVVALCLVIAESIYPDFTRVTTGNSDFPPSRKEYITRHPSESILLHPHATTITITNRLLLPTYQSHKHHTMSDTGRQSLTDSEFPSCAICRLTFLLPAFLSSGTSLSAHRQAQFELCYSIHLPFPWA